MHFATEFWLSRLCFQRALGGIYLIALLIAANQFIPLLGTRGLQPVRVFVRHVSFRRAEMFESLASCLAFRCSAPLNMTRLNCGDRSDLYTSRMSTTLEPVRPIELSEIRSARERIAKTIVRTPLIRLELGPEFPDIRLKLENLQPINAYKLRGAANA